MALKRPVVFFWAKMQNEAMIANSCAGGISLEPLVEGSQLSLCGRNVKAAGISSSWGKQASLLRRCYALRLHMTFVILVTSWD